MMTSQDSKARRAAARVLVALALLAPLSPAAAAQGGWRLVWGDEFEGAKAPQVLRYELPGLGALNFHCLQALGGGQFSSLRLDPLAKGKAQQLLDKPIPVPAALLN